MVHPELLAQAQKDAKAAQEEVERRMAAEDIRWASDTAVAQIGAIGSVVGFRARFADLVI